MSRSRSGRGMRIVEVFLYCRGVNQYGRVGEGYIMIIFMIVRS
ncbi:hypothetical protein GFK82_00762 [Candidatus Steffania adelgidicola]|nr:hypothetical protein GFK82_00762 [Candidatus Steffania adelgidicola]